MPEDYEGASGPHPKGRVLWLRWAMLCDQLRVEMNGKKLLIGCYDHTITLGRRPAVVGVTLAGAFEFVRSGAHKLEFRISTPTSVGVGEIKANEGSEAGGYADFHVPIQTLITEDGEIKLDWRADGGDWGPPMVWKCRFAPDVVEMPADEWERMKELWTSLVDATESD